MIFFLKIVIQISMKYGLEDLMPRQGCQCFGLAVKINQPDGLSSIPPDTIYFPKSTATQ